MVMTYKIPFNKPFIVGKELEYIGQALTSGHICGDGIYTKQCEAFFERTTGTARALLTTSCTSALEMAAILAHIGPGDEVIVPSFTFVSTANAFYVRGATPVFADIRPDTLNLDERLLPDLITEKTRAIVPVHYAGVGCEMEAIMALANSHGLMVIEDAAQAVNAYYQGRPLGSIGQFGAYSFHETKNLTCGEGGVLLVNDPAYSERAEIIREKGTNRSQFFRGQVDKYTWTDMGSSYVLADVLAAFLWAQLEAATEIGERRRRVHETYYQHLQPLAERGLLRLPYVPTYCQSNDHMFYILLADLESRTRLIQHLKSKGIASAFHYVPLHTSKVGLSLGYGAGMLPVSEQVSDTLLRLPFHADLAAADSVEVCREIYGFFGVEFRE